MSGIMEASLTVDRTGFVPGDNIIISVDVNNISEEEVTSARVALVMVRSKMP